jgi:hypothetical protein
LKKAQALPKPKPEPKDNGPGALLFVMIGLVLLRRVRSAPLTPASGEPRGNGDALGDRGMQNRKGIQLWLDARPAWSTLRH